MSITEELNNMREVMSLDKEMLIHKIYEAWNSREAGIDRQSDRFILGLRYSEFLARGTSDAEYFGAERRRLIYLQKLGVTPEYVRTTLKEIYGLN